MFMLWKDWVDMEKDVEMVELHYTWTPIGEEPDWDMEEARVLPIIQETPRIYRGVAIELPRWVKDSPNYSLHYFFFIIQGGRQFNTQTYTEEIASREVKYIDKEGNYTQAGLQWSVENWAAPNYSLMRLEGLPEEEVAGPLVSRVEPGGGVEYQSVYELVRILPLPHIFRARVWGPRGATILHKFHLLRVGCPDPEDDMEVWDDNQGQSFRINI